MTRPRPGQTATGQTVRGQTLRYVIVDEIHDWAAYIPRHRAPYGLRAESLDRLGTLPHIRPYTPRHRADRTPR